MTSAPLVFITGASSGIGQALAARYHRAGYRLALAVRRIDAVQAWARAQGLPDTHWAAYPGDVRDAQAMAETGRACILAQGAPDVVIANAGISIGMNTADFDDLQVMRETLETNVLGVAATFHPFIDAMTQRGSGTLVGVTSVSGIRGLPGHGAYCASKSGAISYCESLRGEMRGTGVKVVTLVPGYVDTPLTQGNRYGMPFLLTPEQFAERAFDAIASGTSYRVIPWQMGWVAKFLRLAPNALFDRAMAGRPRKRRRSQP